MFVDEDSPIRILINLFHLQLLLLHYGNYTNCKVFACPNDNCQRLRQEHEQSKKDGH